MPCNRSWRRPRAGNCGLKLSAFRSRISKLRGNARNRAAESWSSHEPMMGGTADSGCARTGTMRLDRKEYSENSLCHIGVRIALRDQDDFADGAGLHYFFVGASSFSERDLLADNGLERAVLEA